MLLFTPFLETKELLQRIRPDEYNFYEFNLSSYYQCGVNLSLAPDPNYIPAALIEGNMDSMEFDIAYNRYILEQNFFVLMSIVLPLYDDPCACVIIYISQSPIRDLIMECLDKLIQQRYGYRSYLINDLEDIYGIKDDASFSVRGIVNIQEDAQKAMLGGFYGPQPIPDEET